MQIWAWNTDDRKVKHESHNGCDWHDGLPREMYRRPCDIRGRSFNLGLCNDLVNFEGCLTKWEF